MLFSLLKINIKLSTDKFGCHPINKTHWLLMLEINNIMVLYRVGYKNNDLVRKEMIKKINDIIIKYEKYITSYKIIFDDYNNIDYDNRFNVDIVVNNSKKQWSFDNRFSIDIIDYVIYKPNNKLVRLIKSKMINNKIYYLDSKNNIYNRNLCLKLTKKEIRIFKINNIN